MPKPFSPHRGSSPRSDGTRLALARLLATPPRQTVPLRDGRHLRRLNDGTWLVAETALPEGPAPEAEREAGTCR